MAIQQISNTLRTHISWRVVLVCAAVLLTSCSGEFDPENRLTMTLINDSEDRQLYLVGAATTEQDTADRGFSRVGVGIEQELGIGHEFESDSLCVDDDGPLWIFAGPPGFRVQDFADAPFSNFGEMVPDRELWMTLEPEQCFPEREFEIVFEG